MGIWIRSDLSGEGHAFSVGAPKADGTYRPNSTGGYRALCGIVAKRLGAGTPDARLPKCESCAILMDRAAASIGG